MGDTAGPMQHWLRRQQGSGSFRQRWLYQDHSLGPHIAMGFLREGIQTAGRHLAADLDAAFGRADEADEGVGMAHVPAVETVRPCLGS